MHVIRLFISILSDFVTSHKITFYSKLYDIDLLENCTHDRTYITLYVHEFLLSLHQHCFFGQKSPTYYLNYLAPGGGCEVLFSPGLSVCRSVCLSVCLSVCPANTLVFYFSAIRRYIDLKFKQDTYRVVLN